MENLEIYNAVRSVPAEAKSEIKGGRLNGKTDINPMWRIKKLTELFGPCGVGWKYTIDREWLETGANGEISAFMDISLYFKHDGEWSEAVPGTGGSAFIAKEKSGLYTSDECYKMALTDALSVACKALGIAADVYWDKDKTKYSEGPDKTQETEDLICSVCGDRIITMNKGGKIYKTAEEIAEGSKKLYGMQMCYRCLQEAIKNGSDRGNPAEEQTA